MIFKGSMNYDQHGRKRKNKISNRRRSSNGLGHHSFTVAMRDHAPHASPVLEAARKHREKYPSMPIGEYKPEVDTSYKKEVSKNYTVSIAYNKGSYQVIPKDDVEHIGK
tara:strand:+ start:184 stop:510 length:327 start_codon:yes stop_codon:yes gene_type:complete